MEVEIQPPINEPHYEWFVNGRPVSRSHKHDLVYNHGVIILIITNAQLDDAGDYVLRISNGVGESVTSCTVVVSGGWWLVVVVVVVVVVVGGSGCGWWWVVVSCGGL